MAGQGKRNREAQPTGPRVPDGLELRKDGTALFHVDGVQHRLRRPKIGELRGLREGVAKRDEAVANLKAEADADPTIDQGERQREINLEWMVGVMDLLAEPKPPEPDEWPAGMDEVGAIQALLGHWRAVPLRSGA